MIDMTDLIARLDNGLFYTASGEASDAHEQAAFMLRELVAERDRLREVLKPFADAAENLDDNDKDHWGLWDHPASMDLTVKCLRDAHAALGGENG